MAENFIQEAAISGNHKRLKGYIRDKANPCSADEYGITPLMFAVWNGHIECVKLLLANDLGVNALGQRCSCINMISTRCYTALHLSVLDSPVWSAKESTFLLLCMGADPSIKDNDNQTPLEIAEYHDKKDLIAIFRKFDNPDEHTKEKIRLLRKDLLENYKNDSDKLHREPIAPTQTDFPLPRFIGEKTRVGELPNGMDIHEHHIRPLVVKVDQELYGSKAIYGLQFADEQAAVNRERRSNLLMESDPNWKNPPNIDYSIPE
eukprot:gene12732-26817_t